mmetsp:Transcript_951/g.1128  ORF Transcript_951/g.1128 Transcript_951/m.1128 type:complete len:84 (-) Transcript_951:299-550(-)
MNIPFQKVISTSAPFDPMHHSCTPASRNTRPQAFGCCSVHSAALQPQPIRPPLLRFERASYTYTDHHNQPNWLPNWDRYTPFG